MPRTKHNNRHLLTPYEKERVDKMDALIKSLSKPSIEAQIAIDSFKQERNRILHRAANRRYRAE